MSFGDTLKTLRKEKKLSQKKLAEKTGIATITIQQYEANKYKPKIENLQKIALALGTPLSDFFDIENFDTKEDFLITASMAINLMQENFIALLNICNCNVEILDDDNFKLTYCNKEITLENSEFENFQEDIYHYIDYTLTKLFDED